MTLDCIPDDCTDDDGDDAADDDDGDDGDDDGDDGDDDRKYNLYKNKSKVFDRKLHFLKGTYIPISNKPPNFLAILRKKCPASRMVSSRGPNSKLVWSDQPNVPG